MKDQLRGVEPKSDLSPWLPATELEKLSAQKNVAAYLIHAQGKRLTEAARRGWLTDVRLDTIDRTLTELIALQGGCERIKKNCSPAHTATSPARFGYRFQTSNELENGERDFGGRTALTPAVG